MTHALTGIALAVFLSLSSLTVVLLRVSPLTAPEFALPFFFLSVFMFTASLVALLLSVTKGLIIRKPMQARGIAADSIRQGIFAAAGTCILILLWLLRILNWWIAVLVYAVFVLIEMAVGR